VFDTSNKDKIKITKHAKGEGMKKKRFVLTSISFIVALSFFLSSFEIAKSNENDSTAYYYLTYQEPADVYLGLAGVFMVSSSYDAVAVINRFVPDYRYPAEDLNFFDRWLLFGVYDFYAKPFPPYGFNYVYFNLKFHTRQLWDEGELNIYRWDPVRNRWSVCPTYLVETKNLPHGRLSCIMREFGLYGIAMEKSFD
jgi:hypothetical protein